METLSHLENLNINSSCRTCLQDLNGIKRKYDIFAIPGLPEKLSLCSLLPVQSEDGLPKILCQSCHRKIEDFYKFQQMCISARTRFEEHIHSDKKPLLPKKEIEDEHSSLLFEVEAQYETASNDEAEENITNRANLNNLVRHTKRYNFECASCNKRFMKSETFHIHMRLHQGLKAYPCEMCDGAYSTRSRLKLHMRRSHKHYPCTEKNCDKIMSSKKTLQQHIKDEHWKNGMKPKEPYTCEVCGKVWSNASVLTKHRKIHVSQKLPYKCPQCQKGFTTKKLLTKHIDRHDEIDENPQKGTIKERIYKCQFCDKAYYIKQNLKRHIRIFHEGIRNFPCSYCVKSFATSENRKNHEMIHTGERPYECNICQKTFIKITTLRAHQTLHHNSGREVEVDFVS